VKELDSIVNIFKNKFRKILRGEKWYKLQILVFDMAIKSFLKK
jgi:hypothetical protein